MYQFFQNKVKSTESIFYLQVPSDANQIHRPEQL